MVIDEILKRTEQGESLKVILHSLGSNIVEFQAMARKNPQLMQRYKLSKQRQRAQRKVSESFCQQCRNNRLER
jgi:hypothetical protein